MKVIAKSVERRRITSRFYCLSKPADGSTIYIANLHFNNKTDVYLSTNLSHFISNTIFK